MHPRTKGTGRVYQRAPPQKARILRTRAARLLYPYHTVLVRLRVPKKEVFSLMFWANKFLRTDDHAFVTEQCSVAADISQRRDDRRLR